VNDRNSFPRIVRLAVISLFFVIFFAAVSFDSLVFGAEVEILCSPSDITAFQGEKVMVSVEVINRSSISYRNSDGLFFSYHLYDASGKIVSFDNRRFTIPSVLRRNKTTTFKVPLFFEFPKSGHYVVEFDIVKEGVFWGSSKKWKTSRSKLDLKPLYSDEFKNKYLSRMCKTGNELLDREQYLLRLTLKNSELWKDGTLFGFGAGSGYPAVWIRDTATFISLAAVHYPVDSLAEMVSLFFRHQGANGEIVDWVDVTGKTGKNTVETDQESSLVLATAEIAALKPGWVEKKIEGKSIIDRLEMALEWVWENRRDGKLNLITSGFTADWGDVENTFPDQRALRLSDRSTPVFSIYTQAKYIQAMDALVKLLKSMKAGTAANTAASRIKKWEGRAVLVRGQARKILYLPDRGYFLVHRVCAGPSVEKFFKMEREMLAVGGNAEAIAAGLMSKEEIRKFLEVLDKRRREYKLNTVSFTLIPPYPEGFFPHTLLSRPWSYQNGGEWDWIGGRVLKALFLNGFSKEAEKYLLEIAAKNIKNFCIFEWEDREGVARGSFFYSGAAGVIHDAIVKGYCKR
jgi:hypothetical protein